MYCSLETLHYPTTMKRLLAEDFPRSEFGQAKPLCRIELKEVVKLNARTLQMLCYAFDASPPPVTPSFVRTSLIPRQPPVSLTLQGLFLLLSHRMPDPIP